MQIKGDAGDKLGNLQLLRPLRKRKNGYVVWLCRCLICQRKIERSPAAVHWRKKYRCDCLRDAFNVKHQRLTLVEKTNQRSPTQFSSKGVPKPLYRCVCQCGKEVLLTRGEFWTNQSCGCLGEERRRSQQPAFREEKPAWYYRQSKKPRVNRLRKLVRQGKSYGELAKLEGVSSQRISQLLESIN